MTALAHMNVIAADGASSTPVALVTLAAALGGVLLTGLISLATLMLNHRWQSRSTDRRRLQDHNTLVRQERRESYAAYWLAWNRFIHELRRVEEVVRELPSGVIFTSIQIDFPPSTVERHDLDWDGLLKQLRDLQDGAWEAELEWRTATDALLLVADPQVEQAANAHIAMTDQKRQAAWEGKSHHDENGAAYQALNNAMRAALLTAVRPETWDPTPGQHAGQHA
jgi:hypothetical protein